MHEPQTIPVPGATPPPVVSRTNVAPAPMDDAHERMYVVGITGTGKSYYVKRWLTAFAGSRAKRIVVWDPKGEYRKNHPKPNPPSMPNFVGMDLEQFEDHMTDTDAATRGELLVSVKQWARHKKGPRMPNRADDFERFVNIIEESRDLLLVIDETGSLRGVADDDVETLACMSREWDMPLILVAQRAMQIVPNAREQVSRITSFRQINPDDIKALEERMGPKALRVSSLPRFEAVIWMEHEAFRTHAPGQQNRSSP